MKQLAFVTEGAIDTRSFTTFGINAKPNTYSPIGYFGTGLKYAIAVLCRLGGQVQVFINGEEYEFYAAKSEFRDKTFEMVRMRRRKGFAARWRYEALPYTTELGKNWKPWQVFRELESNTRDEGGHTYLVGDDGIELQPQDYAGHTIILVSDPSVIDAYENRHEIFLPTETLHKRLENAGVEIYNHPSHHVYFRGLRVMDIDKPSAFTYNITAPTELTEDRTIKYGFLATNRIMQAVALSDDEEFIRQILKCDPKKSFEGELDFDSLFSSASPTFMNIIKRLKNRGESFLPRAELFYDRYYVSEDADPDVTVTLTRSEWDRISEVMETVDLYEAAKNLGWTEEDERFDPFIRLREKLKGESSDGGAVPF